MREFVPINGKGSICVGDKPSWHEVLRDSGGITPLILNLSTRCGWVVNITTLTTLPPGKNPSNQWIGGWAEPRASRDFLEKKKIPLFLYFLRSWDRASLMYLSITNKMQHYTMVFIIINALHVSGGSSAHHQELKTVHTASGICRGLSSWWWAEEPPETCTAFIVINTIT